MDETELSSFLKNKIESTASLKELYQINRKKIPKKRKHSTKKERLKLKQKNYQNALILIDQGFDRQYISELYGIKKNSLDKAVYKRSNGQRNYPEQKGRKILEKEKYLLFISQLLNESSPKRLLFARDIRQKLLVRFEELLHIKLSLVTIQKWIWNSGFSWKKTSKLCSLINDKDQIEHRKEIALKFATLLKNKRKIVYIDENGLNESMTPHYCYSKKSQSSLVLSFKKKQKT